MEDSGLCHLAEQLLGVFFQAPHLGNASFCRQGFLPHRYLLMVDTLSRMFFCSAPVELTPTADGSSSLWPRSVPFLLLTAAVCLSAPGVRPGARFAAGPKDLGAAHSELPEREERARLGSAAALCRCCGRALWRTTQTRLPLDPSPQAPPAPGLH